MQPELIETILVTADRQLPLLGRHLARLLTSCQALRYRCNEPAVESAIMAAVRGLHAPGPHRLRLLLARDGSHDIQTAPLAPLPPDQEVMLAPEALDADEPLLRYKTTYRPWYAHTIEWLPSHPRVFDLLYLNQHGELCEGSRSNVYLELGGRWYTPPIASGCLPGVQRAELIDQGKVQERTLTMSDLRSAESIRLSNALRGWIEVQYH
ncbi:Probable branched-chain-amino-acid aminotransferase [Bordetella pertussis]|uniref:branched-chain-amino-acid transaminase n=8 Tax=Bordetella TaxID=517 RepID=Q7VU80_BORPE|nr:MULTISPECIES: aminotransferase class IV family protein [Bordetella]ETH38276.1 para-aminobenzoate synthase, component I domain protein [Bordetella pertussis H918]ETH42745.1 para-aminobenzoate synthase, component I domain protein [Bordetella pertussis H939]ETH47033.1 para-aminobenzoate synthase, component I domain protein [Bordetella pertussis H921]ETH73300.1 para-aminobenzoate synthase, component I domain protein [Bordetella pertussis STO1-CHLA-0011]ETH83545.1 para-aminobenzoate synthase, co